MVAKIRTVLQEMDNKWTEALSLLREKQILVVDVDDSTRRQFSFGPIEMELIMVRLRRMANSIAENLGGKVKKRAQGDALILVFPADGPTAGEAALALQHAVKSANQWEPAHRSFEIVAAAAKGLIMEEEEDAIGPTVTLAFRMTKYAKAGQLIVTNKVKDYLPDSFQIVSQKHVKPDGCPKLHLFIVECPGLSAK